MIPTIPTLIRSLKLALIASLVISNCASTNMSSTQVAEPIEDGILIFGTILMENVDMDFTFDYWDWTFDVTVLGCDAIGNISHYTTRTDRDGYFSFSNLPQGTYHLKAIRFQKPGELPNIITNNWYEAGDTYYLMKHPEEGVSYTADWFALPDNNRIVDMQITWFGIAQQRIADMSMESRGVVSVKRFDEDLKSQRIWEDGHLYTRLTPLAHFQQKFPDSAWWSLTTP